MENAVERMAEELSKEVQAEVEEMERQAEENGEEVDYDPERFSGKPLSQHSDEELESGAYVADTAYESLSDASRMTAKQVRDELDGMDTAGLLSLQERCKREGYPKNLDPTMISYQLAVARQEGR